MTIHGVLCGCDVCWVTAGIDDELMGKQIARAAEPDIDEPTDCD